jgi:hypothetical protein
MSEYAVSFQNQPVDVSEEFSKQESHFFVGSNIEEFDQQTATGRLWWKSMALNQRVSYHQITLPLEDYRVLLPPKRCASDWPPGPIRPITNHFHSCSTESPVPMTRGREAVPRPRALTRARLERLP